ncbi:MAG: 4Fe-4S binding protein [Thermoprotei archaeon]|nr:4Fe-4S binding protein [Thermoprotei archaeon]
MSEVCPVPRAIIPRGRIPVFNQEACIGCGRCVNACPAKPKALKLTPRGERRIPWREST